MTLSQIASVLGLDEQDAVRPVPLTDAEIARQAQRQSNRSERRAKQKRTRHLRTGK